jgi:PE family
METFSHDPSAGGIGNQLVDLATQAASSAVNSLMSLTSLLPAGGDEISAQAAMAFAADAAQMMASNTAAQEELVRTGLAFVDIARQYAQADSAAAGTLVLDAAQVAGQQLSSGSGLLRDAVLPGAAGAAARSQLTSQLFSPTTAQAAQSAVSAGSTVAGSVAPLGSLAQGAGTAGAVPSSALASATEQKQDEENRDGSEEQAPGESVL